MSKTTSAKLQEETTQLQTKLADAKARQKAILMRQNAASTRLNVKRKLDTSKVDDALSRFERYERKIDNLEAEIESYDMGKKSLADEIATTWKTPTRLTTSWQP